MSVSQAITSDVGGSTRNPSHYNGLFGHKPTGGAVSNVSTIPYVGTKGVNRFVDLHRSSGCHPLLPYY